MIEHKNRPRINYDNLRDEIHFFPGYLEKDGLWVSPMDNMSMILINGGNFMMGNDSKTAYLDEKPVHEVFLEPFLLDCSKATVESYHKFLQAIGENGGHHPDWCYIEEHYDKSHEPLKWDKQLENPKNPVIGIDWYDAWAYSRWAGKLLPTEAQWEKAEHFIKLYKNEMEMLKTGWEWCLDWYSGEFYKTTNRYEPCCWQKENTKENYRVAKGSVEGLQLPLSRLSFRNRYPAEHRDEYLGFRCVKRLF